MSPRKKRGKDKLSRRPTSDLKRPRQQLNVEEAPTDELLEITTTKASYHVGPLPSPELFQEYSKVLPDLPERIVKSWENESEHRRLIEREAVLGSVNLAKRGQAAAAFLSTIIVSGALFLVYSGKSLEGLALVFGQCVALVWAFRKSKQSEEQKEDKAPSSTNEDQ